MHSPNMDRTGGSMNQDAILPNRTSNVMINSIGNYENFKAEDIEPDTSSDVVVLSARVVPSATGKLPCREEYPGPYNFNVLLNADTSLKNRWLYSHSLKKVFVSMLSKVCFQFKWTQKEAGLYVRAMLVYCSEDHFERPVVRCPNHSSPIESCNIGFQYVDHVIRCNNDRAEYHKNPDSKRLSVVVPLDAPHPGTDWVTVLYTFVCKNSCNVGMNRRATAIIFTLERSNGEVIGRKSMGVRICSCPKRDKEKEETDLVTRPQSGRRHARVRPPSMPESDARIEHEQERDPLLIEVDYNTNCALDEGVSTDNAEEAQCGETENEDESDGGGNSSDPNTNSNKYLKVRKPSFLLPPNKRKHTETVAHAVSLPVTFVRDEFSVFGEHIGMRLRNIKDAKVRILLQRKINEILFEGEMTNFGSELKL